MCKYIYIYVHIYISITSYTPVLLWTRYRQVQHLGTEGGRCEEIEGLGRFVVRTSDALLD